MSKAFDNEFDFEAQEQMMEQQMEQMEDMAAAYIEVPGPDDQVIDPVQFVQDWWWVIGIFLVGLIVVIKAGIRAIKKSKHPFIVELLKGIGVK